jgi:lipopolysaccharide biosynthesis glycosyltransferase
MKTEAISRRPDDIVVVCATDDGYAMPLAVTIRSLLDYLGKDRRVRLIVLDGGLSATSRERLLKSWQDDRLTVEWTAPDMRLISDLQANGHVSVSTYLRLLMPKLLPSSITRAIYLDADVLVRRDIGKLWDVPMQGHAVLAAQDTAAPWVDSAVMLPNIEDCRSSLSAVTPIANFRDLGIAAESPYFNGGVLVVDLDVWRRGNYAEKCLACLRDNRDHVLFWDQYALNVVLNKQWGQLDLRWNQAAHIYLYHTWQESPFDQEIYERVRSDPWIVHYCSPSKPWHYFNPHPFTKAWRHCQKNTEWRGERPQKFIKKLWDNHYRPVKLRVKRRAKLVRKAIQARFRKAA